MSEWETKPKNQNELELQVFHKTYLDFIFLHSFGLSCSVRFNLTSCQAAYKILQRLKEIERTKPMKILLSVRVVENWKNYIRLKLEEDSVNNEKPKVNRLVIGIQDTTNPSIVVVVICICICICWTLKWFFVLLRRFRVHQFVFRT